MSLKQRLTMCGGIPAFVLSLLAAGMLTACGGGKGDTQSRPTGRCAFQVQWDRQDSTERWGVDDCLDVDTVSAAAYNTSGGLLQTGGPWNCGDGQGAITQVPAERYVRVAIVGLTTAGLARYRGESTNPLYLPAGQTVDAGLIIAPAFLATLTSPADGATVYHLDLTLAWNAVTGADHYVVQIADDITFAAAAILQTLTVTASADPACQPDTSSMIADATYFWRVQVVDGAGNTSEPSGHRQFSVIDNRLPTAQILVPADGATHSANSDLSCQGTGTDPEDGTLVGTALQWQLFGPGSPTTPVWTGSGENPQIGQSIFRAAGTGAYRITLQVTDSAGGSDSVSHNFNVIGV